MDREHIEAIEVDLLLEAVFLRYGHDFRKYARSHVERRLERFRTVSGARTLSELIPRLLYDESLFERFLQEFSITVTEMFRDPSVFRELREKVIPLLRTYPFFKVWVAGCATGEEAYSLAILLEEEGLLERATIFATDFNDTALDRAKEGVYPIEAVKRFAADYEAAGGSRSFSEYFHASYDAAILNPALRKKILFANHNLATDGVFSEMHLILCRNVLIYFTKPLQDRVLSLFCESLVRGGFLCLGSREALQFSAVGDQFRTIDKRARIFQKVEENLERKAGRQSGASLETRAEPER